MNPAIWIAIIGSTNFGSTGTTEGGPGEYPYAALILCSLALIMVLTVCWVFFYEDWVKGYRERRAKKKAHQDLIKFIRKGYGEK